MASAKRHKGNGGQSGSGNSGDGEDEERISYQDSGSECDDEDDHSSQVNSCPDQLSRLEKRIKKEHNNNNNSAINVVNVSPGFNDFSTLAHPSLNAHIPMAFSQSALIGNNSASLPSAHSSLANHPSSTVLTSSSSGLPQPPVAPLSPAQHLLSHTHHTHLHHTHLHHPHSHHQPTSLSHLHHSLPLTAHPNPAFLAALQRQ